MKSSVSNAYTSYETIEELKLVTTHVEVDEWGSFFSLVKKGIYNLYGFHQFLNEKPELSLIIQDIDDYQPAIQEMLEEIGLNKNDVNGPGANHMKLIAANNKGVIVYETEVMNY